MRWSWNDFGVWKLGRTRQRRCGLWLTKTYIGPIHFWRYE